MYVTPGWYTGLGIHAAMLNVTYSLSLTSFIAVYQ